MVHETCADSNEAAAFITGQVCRRDGGFGLKTITPMYELGEPPAQLAFDGFYRSVRLSAMKPD